jgi:hypothetical protein
VVGIPPTSAHLPREAPNPLMAAHLGLGIALRLWRDDFPVADGGTAILLHPLRRRLRTRRSSPTASSSRRPLRPRPEDLRDAERVAASDLRAIAAYREGRACHPLLPFADWAACQPAVARLGAVLVAGCRDAAPRVSSGSSRRTASEPRSTWRAGAARGGSASSSRRRTSRCASDYSSPR